MDRSFLLHSLLIFCQLFKDTHSQLRQQQQIQCYACGLSQVKPDSDFPGSYGRKRYNNSCDELLHLRDNRSIKTSVAEEDAYVRVCPVGVKSCFGASGYYDHRDLDPTNDLKFNFLGCSEAKRKHTYGCEKELQNVDIKDKTGHKMQVEIELTLCFCSERTCNDPKGDLFASSSSDKRTNLLHHLLCLGLLWTTGLLAASGG